MTAHTLTTADIETFATRRLDLLRGRAQKEHAAAKAMPGSLDALQCARRIGVMADHCEEIGALSGLADFHCDYEAATRIDANLAATVALMLELAHDCRLISVPKSEAA